MRFGKCGTPFLIAENKPVIAGMWLVAVESGVI